MTQATHFDRIVVGGGAMGLATAWQLANRGIRVLLLERFEFGHTRGASHGATRNMNNAYAEDLYLDLYDEALDLWRELECESNRTLVDLKGIVTHGQTPAIRATYDALRARGGNAELISPREAEGRWPGMRFEGEVLVNRDAGRIYSAQALEVLNALTRSLGAELRYEHRVLEVTETLELVRVRAEHASGEVHECTADGVVVTAGAWSPPLLRGIVDLPPLRITEEHPAHFDALPGYESTDWPSFNHFAPVERTSGFGGNIYGMHTPGEGVKVGFHATGEVVDPDARRYRASEEARARLRAYVTEWFPGLDAQSASEISCTYTTTPSERFILDRVGRITVGAGFSGHGFKFVPAVGRILAEASLGISHPPKEFQLASHQS